MKNNYKNKLEEVLEELNYISYSKVSKYQFIIPFVILIGISSVRVIVIRFRSKIGIEEIINEFELFSTGLLLTAILFTIGHLVLMKEFEPHKSQIKNRIHREKRKTLNIIQIICLSIYPVIHLLLITFDSGSCRFTWSAIAFSIGVTLFCINNYLRKSFLYDKLLYLKRNKLDNL